MILSFFFVSAMSFAQDASNDLSLIWQNNSAVREITQGKNLEAHENFVSLLARAPYDSYIQFNIGSSLDVLGEAEKAEQSYVEILKSTDKLLQMNPSVKDLKKIFSVRFATLFNLGTHAGAKKEVDKALDYYQRALEISPDSREVKTNIELLIQQGQGGGQGDNQNQDQNDSSGEGKDQKDQDKNDQKDKKQNKPDEKKDEQQKNQPKDFDSKQMSKEDLKRILEELKEQEQGIRAKMQRKGDKNDSNAKDW